MLFVCLFTLVIKDELTYTKLHMICVYMCSRLVLYFAYQCLFYDLLFLL